MKELTVDYFIYPRESRNKATVEAYKTAIEAGAEFPPVEYQAVNNYNGDSPNDIYYLITDGVHRYAADDETEQVVWLDNMLLDYQEYKLDLLLRSHELNSINAKNLTNVDKKKTARKIAIEKPEMTNATIAEELGVTKTTVGEWVKDIRARQQASRDSIIFRLSKLGWTQEEIADVVELSRNRISEIVDKSDFGFIDIPPNSTIEEVAEANLLDLTVAYTKAYGHLKDLELLKKIDIKVRPYDVWNFAKNHDIFGLDYPGRIPGELIAHVLFFFTKRGDTVLDPMSGGGTTQDVCLYMGRQCYAYDMNPDIERVDYKLHNLSDGFPDTTKKADLIFFDPPYFSKKDKEYIEGSVSGLEKERYLQFFKDAFESAYTKAKKGAMLAFLMSDWDDEKTREGVFLWDYADAIQEAGWHLFRQIQAPLSTEQMMGATIENYRENKKLGRIERYLLIGEKR